MQNEIPHEKKIGVNGGNASSPNLKEQTEGDKGRNEIP